MAATTFRKLPGEAKSWKTLPSRSAVHRIAKGLGTSFVLKRYRFTLKPADG